MSGIYHFANSFTVISYIILSIYLFSGLRKAQLSLLYHKTFPVISAALLPPNRPPVPLFLVIIIIFFFFFVCVCSGILLVPF